MCLVQLQRGNTVGRQTLTNFRSLRSAEEKHAEASTLQTTVARREAQLVALVKELYVLAAAEKTPGRIDHASRSRLFKQSADVYESLGAAAFGGGGDDGAPENESGQLPP